MGHASACHPSAARTCLLQGNYSFRRTPPIDPHERSRADAPAEGAGRRIPGRVLPGQSGAHPRLWIVVLAAEDPHGVAGAAHALLQVPVRATGDVHLGQPVDGRGASRYESHLRAWQRRQVDPGLAPRCLLGSCRPAQREGTGACGNPGGDPAGELRTEWWDRPSPCVVCQASPDHGCVTDDIRRSSVPPATYLRSVT